jgi:hypothetical protein
VQESVIWYAGAYDPSSNQPLATNLCNRCDQDHYSNPQLMKSSTIRQNKHTSTARSVVSQLAADQSAQAAQSLSVGQIQGNTITCMIVCFYQWWHKPKGMSHIALGLGGVAMQAPVTLYVRPWNGQSLRQPDPYTHKDH